VTRTADERRPVDLLDAIVDHLTSHGVSELSLRPLAKAVRSSPRVLLYYFGSKEELVARALERMRERQRAAYAVLSALPAMKTANPGSPAAACRAIWRHMSAPDSEPAFRLFFDAYAFALRHPRRLADFLHASVEDWLTFIAAPLRRSWPAAEARAFATIVLAGFRGFMLDYTATRDRKRIDRAVDLWLKSLDTIPMTRGRRP
jgi:AcrR family transcriptional regulator